MDSDLAHALVALPGFEWLPGMRMLGRYGAEYPWRVCVYGEQVCDEDAAPADPKWWYEPRQVDGGPYHGPWLPDLDDPATGGVLLGMLSAVAERRVETHTGGRYGAVCGVRIRILGNHAHAAQPRGPQRSWSGPTLAHACAAALVALGRCG